VRRRPRALTAGPARATHRIAGPYDSPAQAHWLPA